MKLFKKRWHRLPIGILTVMLLACLVAGSAFAAFSPVTQTITQEITEPPTPSSITADPITLPDVVAGESWGCQAFPGAVVVVVGDGDANKYLHLRIDDTTTGAYDVFAGNITSKAEDNPMGSLVALGVTYTQTGPAPNILEASFLLTKEGTYTFEQTVCGIAGNTPGSQEVKWIYTLEDLPYQP
ncbi:hypothetical protein ES703_116184 [subsurface metagenome]